MEDYPGLIVVLALMAACVVYFLPTIVAKTSHHPQTTAIYVLNALLGWTLIGWVIALVWAFIVQPKESRR